MTDGHKYMLVLFVALAMAASGCGPSFSGCEASRTCPKAPEGGMSASGGAADGPAGQSDATAAGARAKGGAGPSAGADGSGGSTNGPNAGMSKGGQPADEHDRSDGGAHTADSGGGAGGASDPVLMTVRVVDSGDQHLIQGATVFASDADGELLQTARTQKDGTAYLEVPSGGTVSAALTATQTYDGETKSYTSLASAFQVQSGATVTLAVYDPADVASPKPMHVMVTLEPAAKVTAQTEVQLPCGGTFLGRSGSPEIWEFDSVAPCANTTTFDIWGLVFDEDGALSAFASDLGVPFTPGGTAERSLDANDTSFRSARLNVSGIPPGCTGLNYGVLAYWDERTTQAIVLDDNVESPSIDETLKVRYPAAEFGKYLAWAALYIQDEPSQQVVLARTGTGVSQERDWSVDRLARFAASTEVDHHEVVRPVASWKLLDSGALGDAIEIDLSWTEASWQAFLPAQRSGKARLPKLPDSLSDLRPSAQDEFFAYAVHKDVVETADYADYLARANQLTSLNIEYADTR